MSVSTFFNYLSDPKMTQIIRQNRFTGNAKRDIILNLALGVVASCYGRH